MKDEFNKLPLGWRQKLLGIARRMPKDKAKVFLRGAVRRLTGFVHSYPRTIGYTTAGYLVGTIVDNLPVIGYFTGGKAAYVGAAIGFGVGMGRDRRDSLRDLEERVARAVRDALRDAGYMTPPAPAPCES